MSLIGLLIFVIVLVVVFWVLSQVPVGQPWKNILTALVALIAIVYLLSVLGILAGGPVITFR